MRFVNVIQPQPSTLEAAYCTHQHQHSIRRTGASDKHRAHQRSGGNTMAAGSVVAPVATTSWGMEYSVHTLPPAMAREVQAVFPDVDLAGALLVPTCQRAGHDLVRTGDTIEVEKDRLLERFMVWARAVCGALQARGRWCDYIDPCSGLPMVQQGTSNVYAEVEALSLLLGFKTQNAGCCKIVLHPKWGSSVYPATLFAKAPLEELQAAIAEAERAMERGEQGQEAAGQAVGEAAQS